MKLTDQFVKKKIIFISAALHVCDHYHQAIAIVARVSFITVYGIFEPVIAIAFIIVIAIAQR